MPLLSGMQNPAAGAIQQSVIQWYTALAQKVSIFYPRPYSKNYRQSCLA